MYRTHSQRILDAIIGGAVEEVQNLLLHFWQGMPAHLAETLNTSLISDVIGLCDSILYQVLIDVLIPESISEIPDSIDADILHLAKNISIWTKTALEETTDVIKKQKEIAVRQFTNILQRHRSFLQLAHIARAILLSQENVSAMSRDLQELDLSSLSSNIFGGGRAAMTFKKVLGEFQDLLKKHAPVDAYVEWIDCVLHRCIVQEEDSHFRECASKFLMLEAHFTSGLLRDLTLKHAKSYGSLHTVHQALQEYALLAIETIQAKSGQKQLKENLIKHMKTNVSLNTKPKFRTNSKRHLTDDKATCSLHRKYLKKSEEKPPHATDHQRNKYLQSTMKYQHNRLPITDHHGNTQTDAKGPSATNIHLEWGRSSTFTLQPFGHTHSVPSASANSSFLPYACNTYGLDHPWHHQSRSRVGFDAFSNRCDDTRYMMPQRDVSSDRYHHQYCDAHFSPPEASQDYSTAAAIAGNHRGFFEYNQQSYAGSSTNHHPGDSGIYF
ncbi:DNA-binding protein RFX6-like [Apostichopus japonicus]|uniref:DNA-binding protein RFX6-like n=1 Tax=Stichopus japonicus TaxID=307972 RepID=UPI003AB46B7C